MIKTMLLPVLCDPTDAASFSIAASAARTLGAHIEFLYARTDPAAILVAAGGAELGPNLNAVALLEEIEKEERERAGHAKRSAEVFCESHGIAIADSPPGPSGASAAWRDYVGERTALLTERARFNDLVILGGEKDVGGLLPEEIGTVMMNGGRPVLLAPRKAPSGFAGTVVVAWKNRAEAARAVSAAMPFLSKAGQILIVHVNENEAADDGSLAAIAEYLRWRGLGSTPRRVSPNGRSGPEALLAAAAEANADLLVMGGYGHSRMLEMVFGGFTRRVLSGVNLPVLMHH